MPVELTVTKLEAAKRQLITAVTLYFNDADPVSIHSLVCAAHEILSELNKRRHNRAAIVSDNLIREEHKKKVRKKLREARNFFKHADKDPDGVLRFNPETNDFYLFDACEMYQLLTGEKLPHFISYRGWFNYKYPELLNVDTSQLIAQHYGDDKLQFLTDMLASSGRIK